MKIVKIILAFLSVMGATTIQAGNQLSLIAIKSDGSEVVYALSEVQRIEIDQPAATMVIRGKDGNARPGTRKIVLAFNNPAGVSTYESEQGLTYVYPNPVKETLTLVCRENEDRKPIRIYNIQGEKVIDMQSSGSAETAIDVSGLRAGSYIITSGTQSVKFIKK